MKNIRNMFNGLNKFNLNKFLIIFMVGFVSRILVGYFYNNVYLDFFNTVSLLNSTCMSAFIVLIQGFVHYFNNIPFFSYIYEIYNIIINNFCFIVRKLIYINKRIFSYKLENIKISSIIKGTKYLFNTDKATLDLNQPDTSSKNDYKTKIIDSKSIKENSYTLEKNCKNVSKKALPRQGYQERSFARRLEIIQIREQAERIAQERLRSGSMTGGEINIDTNSQIGSNRIRDEERRYQESLVLPSILNGPLLRPNNYNYNNNLLLMQPRVNNNFAVYNTSAYFNSQNNYQNSTQSNNNTDNNQKNNYRDNSENRTNNSTSNSK